MIEEIRELFQTVIAPKLETLRADIRARDVKFEVLQAQIAAIDTSVECLRRELSAEIRRLERTLSAEIKAARN